MARRTLLPMLLVPFAVSLLTTALADDTADLKVLVEKFFALYAKKDFDAFMALWSEKSPDYASRKQTMQQLFAANDYSFANLTVSRVKGEGGKATLRAAVDSTTVNAQSKRSSKQWMVRNFALVKEEQGWKVWRDYPAVEDLATALVAAKTEDERKALLAADKELVTPELRDALHRLGHGYERGGRHAMAVKAWFEWLSLAESAGDKRGAAEALSDIGNVHELQGRYAEALDSYQKSLTITKALGDPAGIANALGSIGNVHGSQRRYAEALDSYQRSLTIKEALGDRAGIAATLINIGNIHSSQGNYAQALDFYQKGLTIAEAVGHKQWMGNALRGIGNVHELQGRYAEALDSYQKSQTIKEALGDRAGSAATLNTIGIVHSSQGNYRAALEFFEKSQKLREELDDRAGMAGTLINLGIVHFKQGNYRTALEFYQKGLTIAEAIGHRRWILNALNNIGIVHHAQGNDSTALEFYQKTQKLSDRAGLASLLGNIGNVHYSQGNYVAALESYRESLKLFEELGDRAGLAGTLGNIGVVHRSQRNYRAALEYYQKSLKLKEELGDRAGLALTLNNIGNVHYLQGDYSAALEFCQKSLAISLSIGAPESTFHSYWGIGDTHKAQGKKPEAIAAYQKGIEFLENIRGNVAGGEEEKLTYLHAGGKEGVYQALVSLLVEQGNVKEALLLLERARSKQLLDGLRLSSLTAPDPKLRELLTKTEDLELALAAQEKQRLAELSKPDDQQNKTKLGNLTRLIADTKADLFKVRNSIVGANPDYERFITVKVPELSRIQNRLPADVVVVQYLPLETALTVFIVTNKDMKARSVAVPRKRIEELVQEFHDRLALAQREGGEGVRDWDWNSDRAKRLRGTLTLLYGYLIAPIQRDIANANTVVIVPSGMLYYLPFQALAREVTDEDRGSKIEDRTSTRQSSILNPRSSRLRFFIEDKRLAVLPSLALWLRILDQEEERKGKVRKERVGAFGNPDGTLPAAEQEVKRIGAAMENSLVYVRDEATRAKLESLPTDVTVAHLATHGALNERDFNACYLKFANGEKLKLGDVYGLEGKYPARLTVLSACETAVGRRDPGNEVVHMADAFVQAGSTSVIASLWRVADEATATLMEKFYNELKQGKPIAEAKRQTEIAMLKDKRTAHPYFWAPFVLIGDWR